MLLGLALLLGLVAHANGLRHAFVWDDVQEVQANRSIEDLSHPIGIIRHNPTRPLVNLSYAVDYRIWGGRDEFGFHLTNLVLHLVNIALLFTFTQIVVLDRQRSIGIVRPIAANVTAFAAASLLAVHPMMTEAVAYVSSRSELLCGCWILLSLLCFRQFLERRSAASVPSGRGHARWLAGCLVCFVLALGSKEIAAMLPVVLLLYDFLLRTDTSSLKRSRFTRLHLPLIGLVLAAGAFRIWLFLAVEHPAAARAEGHPVLLQAQTMVRYLALFFVPVGQTIVPIVAPLQSLRDARIVEAVLGLTLAAVVVVLARRSSPLVSFGIAFFFLLLLPSSALKVLSEYGQTMSEHRTYVASFGLFMAGGVALAWLVERTDKPGGRVRRLFAVTGFAALIVVLMGLTISRNRVWAGPVALWADAASKAPRTWLAVQGLGEAYRQVGACHEALEPYRRAIELRPEKAESYLGLGWCLLDLGQIPAAAETFRLGMSRAPENPTIPLQLGLLEEQYFRDPSEALRLCRTAVELSPDFRAAQDCVRRNQRKAPDGRH